MSIAKWMVCAVAVGVALIACSDPDPTFKVEEVKSKHGLEIGGKTSRVAFEYSNNSVIKRKVEQSMQYLKDPASAQFAISRVNQVLLQSSDKSYEFIAYNVCVIVNAKNSFGAYSGFSPMIVVLIDDHVRLVDDPYDTCNNVKD